MTLDPSGDRCRILQQLCDDFSALPANLTAVMRTGDMLQCRTLETCLSEPALTGLNTHKNLTSWVPLSSYTVIILCGSMEPVLEYLELKKKKKVLMRVLQ